MGRVPKRKRKLVLIPRPRSCYNFLCTPQLEEVTMKRQRGKKGGRILLHHCCAFAACLRAASFVSSFFQAPEGTGTLLFCSATLTEVVTWAAPQRTCSHEPKFGGEPGGERQEGQVNSQSTVLLSHCQGLSEILPSAPHLLLGGCSIISLLFVPPGFTSSRVSLPLPQHLETLSLSVKNKRTSHSKS